MTVIFSYGEWIDITQRGTSGDQVGDILESWKADAYKLLDANNIIQAQRDTLLAALQAIAKKPYGCWFCNSGILRNPQKGHEPDCPFELARLALSLIESEQEKEND